MADNDPLPLTDHQATEWYVRTDDDTVYGPLPLTTLYEWACQNRLTAGHTISGDRENWVPVESLGDLKMHWTASMDGGEIYGPFNLSAVPHLVDLGVLDPTSVVKSQASGRSLQVHSLLRLGHEPALSSHEAAPPPDESVEHVETAPSDEPGKRHHVPVDVRELLQVEDDLELLDAVIQLQQELENSQRTVEEFQQNLESTERSTASLREELADDRESYTSRIEELTRQLNDAKRELGQARASSAGMKKEIAEVQCRHSLSQKRQSERVSVLEKHVAALDEKSRALKKERDSSLRRLAEHVEQLTDLEILEASLTARNQELERLQSEVDSANAKREENVEQTKALLTDLKRDAERARQEAAALRKKSEVRDREHLAQISVLNEAKAAADDRAEELEETVHTLIGTRNELAERAADLERRRVTAEQRIEELLASQSDFDSMAAALAARTDALEALRKEHEELGRVQTDATAVLQKEVASLREQLASAAAETQQRQREANRHAETLADVQAAAADGRQRLDELREVLRALTEERDSLRQRSTTLEDERDAARAQIAGKDDFLGQLEACQRQLEAVQEELEATRSELGTVGEKHARNEAVLQAELERLSLKTQSGTETYAREEADLRAEVERLRVELEAITATQPLEETALSAETETLWAELRSTVQAHSENEASLQAEAGQLRTDLQRAKDEMKAHPPDAIAAVSAQLRERDNALREVERRHEETLTVLSALRAKHETVVTERDAARTAFADALREQEADGASELARLTAELQERDAALAQLRTEHETLLANETPTDDDLRREIRNLRHELERASGEAFDLREEREALQNRVTNLS